MSMTVYVGVNQQSMVQLNESSIAWQRGMSATAAGGNCLWTAQPLEALDGPLNILLTCTATSGGVIVSGSNGGNMQTPLSPSPGPGLPSAIKVIYEKWPPEFAPGSVLQTTRSVATAPLAHPCPQLVHANADDCSVLRVPNSPDCYTYSHNMQVRVFGGGYSWEAEPVPLPHGPLYIKVRCRGPLSGGSGMERDGLLVVYITAPVPAHQPAPVPVYYLRGVACPPTRATVTRPPG